MTGKTRKREIRCAKCGWWWHHPKEPVHFASWDEWAEEHQEKETLACPSCGERTEVSEGTVRFTEVTQPEKGKPAKRKG
jgi:DNA-directed RNA polymerase subunit RPC12/RpoP